MLTQHVQGPRTDFQLKKKKEEEEDALAEDEEGCPMKSGISPGASQGRECGLGHLACLCSITDLSKTSSLLHALAFSSIKWG